MRFALRLISLCAALVAATDNVGCWPTTTTEWDPADVCTGGSGHNNACGTESDRCPVTVAEDDDIEPGDKECNECVTIKYTSGTEKIVYGTVVGMEDNENRWDIRVNQNTFTKLGGTGVCGTNTGVVAVVDVDTESDCSNPPPVVGDDEVTCWAEGTTDWDPSGECKEGAAPTPYDYDGDCGTAANPCPVTIGEDDEIEADDRECSSCVTIAYGAQKVMHGYVVGMMANQKAWDARVNEKAFATLGGSGGCSDTNKVMVEVDTNKDGTCVKASTTTAKPGSGAAQTGAVIAIAGALGAIFF
eukprot:Polyplicarium_translucidae@DN1623_c0_g1_i1.p1